MQKKYVIEPNPNFLILAAAADAIAMAVEFLEGTQHQNLTALLMKKLDYHVNPNFTDRSEPTMYTDDTEMTLAIMEAVLYVREHNVPLSKELYAEFFLQKFNDGGKRYGYGKGFREFLLGCPTADHFLEHIKPHSKRNGAAMRAMPIGFLSDLDELQLQAYLQATLTHDTYEGRLSSLLVAAMVHYTLYEARDYSAFLDWFENNFNVEQEGKRYCAAMKIDWDGHPVLDSDDVPIAITTVHAVLTLLKQELTLSKIIQTTIRWGGDTDTVAFLGVGIAAIRQHRYDDLDSALVDRVENGNNTHLKTFARDFIARFGG